MRVHSNLTQPERSVLLLIEFILERGWRRTCLFRNLNELLFPANLADRRRKKSAEISGICRSFFLADGVDTRFDFPQITLIVAEEYQRKSAVSAGVFLLPISQIGAEKDQS